MKSSYWKEYWQNSHEIATENLQVQVARTRMGKPIDENSWLKTLEFVEALLELEKRDVLLDICGGNGLFASKFESMCQRIVVVDVNAGLLANLAKSSPKIITVHAELIDFLENNSERFDKVLFYAGIQYFSEFEVFQIFSRLKEISNPGAIILIGDVPDFYRRDSFLSDNNRFERYFDNLKDEKETIGTWFTFEWISALSHYLKFESCTLIVQPEYQIYSDFRFDVVIRL